MSSLLNFFEENKSLLTFTTVGLVGGLAWYYGNKRSGKDYQIPTKWEEIGKVDEILIYSFKSAKAISVPTADATDMGLKHGHLADRSFLLMNENGNMITGRENYKIVTLETSLKQDNLIVTTLDGDSLAINYNDLINQNKKIVKFKIRGDPVQGIDCGDVVAEWMSKQLYNGDKKVRLVYVGKEKWTRPKRNLEFYNFPLFLDNDSTRFFDTSSYNMTNTSSLKDINSKISKPVSMKYFRPSIVVGGAPAFDEDTWEFVKIGDHVIFHAVKPCERCILTQVNPDTGIISKEHYETLAKYRTPKHPPELARVWKHKPIFGIHCGIDVTGRINVGDKVYISRNKNPYWHV